MKDVAVVGGGAAGLSAAVYCARAGFETIVFDKGGSSLREAEKIDNYLGFPDGVRGRSLLEKGRKHSVKFGAKILKQEVLELSKEDVFYNLETSQDEFQARGLIIATGASLAEPDIEGLKKFKGSGVSFCAQCDGFFFKDKPVAVLGSKNFAAKEAMVLLNWTSDVRLLTDGKDVELDKGLAKSLKEEGISVNKGSIQKLEGGDQLEKVVIDGDELDVSGLFVAIGGASGADLARMLGVPLKGRFIQVKDGFFTGEPRVYAAGDCVEGKNQVSIAVGEGAKAALNLMDELKGIK